MKTTLVIVALMSVALVGCGKKSSKSGGGTFSSYASSTLGGEVIIPQQSAYANNTPPQVQVGGAVYSVSQQSSYQARQAIQQMYAGQGGFVLVSQDAQVRRFRATITGTCQAYGSYGTYGNTQYGSQYGTQYGQNTVCQSGSTLVIQTLQP